MELGYDTWAFVVSLAAVVNGLGIVRLLGTMSDYLRKRSKLDIQHYWAFNLLSVFQLLLHVLLWWSLLSIREAGSINFLTYLYLLAGPTLLFLASSFLVPDVDTDSVDMRQEYELIRKPYYSILIAFFIWVVLLWPVFVGSFAPTLKLISVFLAISIVLRFTSNSRAHAAGVIGMCLVYALFVAIYAMQLGAVGRVMTQG